MDRSPATEIKTEADLIPPGAARGTVPTDLEQATGLERLEILGKMQGIDIFDMSPLPSDRLGTFEDPIVVKSAGEEFQAGCTGSPADSHNVSWLVVCFASFSVPHSQTSSQEPQTTGVANGGSIAVP
jgi:cytochrome c oxidase subunit 5b